MNFCKKILCILFIFCMMFTMQPISIFAKSEDVNGKSIRYSVLILDTSGSMRGVPSDIQKEAAIKFCNSIFTAEGENYVAIVKLASKSSIGCEFTNNINVLTDYINKIPASGGTNINQALNIADELLNTVSNLDSKVIKNIILCSDGLPENGETSLHGPYTEIDNSTYYHYSNSVFNTSTLLKEKYNIYTLGFFHSLDGSELKFGRRLMEDIQNTGYYEVTDVDKLEFSFGEIANNILNGNNLLDDLRRTYINQHKKYFHTSYSADIIYTDLNNGLKSLMEDAEDDYSNILHHFTTF